MTRPRAARQRRDAAPAAAVTPTPDGAEAEARPAARPDGLRMAGLHLRMGQLSLARAELESFAGRGLLDEPALLDLAEARWRTGDLAGAGDAANALLARGREEPLALVVAAEAVAALGRPGEARRLAGRALAAADGPLDPLFAGMPRALIWPGDAEAPVVPEEPEPGADAGGHAALGPGTGRRQRGRRVGPAPEPDAAAAPNAAVEAFAGGRAALASGAEDRAALLLGVALRLDPGFAQGVLDAIGERDASAQLSLVAGDALRLLGREAEALASFDRAGGHRPAAGSETSRAGSRPAPGLFDGDVPAEDEEPGA